MKVFKLKRLTKLAKEYKLFSKSMSDIDKFIMEHKNKFFERIFKILILGSGSCEKDIPHWCDLICGDMNQLDKDLNPTKMFLPLVDNFKGLPRRYGQFYVNRLRGGKSRNDFIESIKSIIKTAGGEEPKYAAVYKVAESQGLVPSNDTLVQMVKFAVLCMTGQMNIDNDNWYDPEVLSMQVDWDKDIEFDSKKLEKIFRSILGLG